MGVGAASMEVNCGRESDANRTRHEQENLQNLLLQCDRMDIIELKLNLNRFGLAESHDDGLEQMKLELKRSILEEILKTNTEERDYFEKCLEVVTQKIKRRRFGYDCCFSGCRFQASRHTQYVVHLKRTHPHVSNIKCNFKKVCIRMFNTIEDLIAHVKIDHSSVATYTESEVGKETRKVNPVDTPCKCNLFSCGSQHFRNVQELMTHINVFHQNDSRQCIFQGCDKQFPPSYTSRNHFRRKHLFSRKMSLKNLHILNPISGTESQDFFEDIPDNTDQVEDEDGFGDHYDDLDIDHLENCEEDPADDDESLRYFLDYYADFLNRLVHEKFIPKTTVQDIADEYFLNTTKAQRVREKKLRNSLQETRSISQEEVDKIVELVIEDDFFLKAQKHLNTDYKRSKYIKENMQYVGPIEILLNKTEVEKGEKKDVIHYIPLQEALKNLMQDGSVIKMFGTEKVGASKEGVIADITDGSLYKSNPFFRDNEDSMGLVLYSDGVEIKVVSVLIY